jgi:nitroimidazol reductase NimA-like FMN-containing flavoprotein (pyridoxamine 5'-phosphate oxidase superfamily)
MYEMRRKDKEVADWKWMEDVLKRGRFLHLGMADADGWPYVVPIGYAYKDGAIYVHGASQGRKNDILAVNPKVCFQVTLDAEVLPNEVGSKFTMKYRSVTGFGVVHNLTDAGDRNAALKILMDRYGGPHTDYPEGSEMHKKLWVARLDIESMTGKKSVYPD